MPAGDDELVPPRVDKKALLRRWISFCPPGVVSDLSAHVPGADHVVSRPEAQRFVAERVVAFLGSL